MTTSANNWQNELHRLMEYANKLNIPNLFNLEDPHLKQLLESTGFMIMDVKNDLNNFEPFLIQQLFSMMYPSNYIISSKCIVEYIPIKKKIALNTVFITNNDCYFRTIEDIHIYPLTIINVEIVENKFIDNVIDDFLHIKITSTEKIYNLSMNTLQFYTNNHEIIESIFNTQNAKEVIVTGDNIYFTRASVKWKTPTYSNGIEIIEEYVNLKELYNFFIIDNINTNNIGEELHIYIPISYTQIENLHLRLNTFVLENSFEGTTEPIKLDFKNIKYLLTPNSSKKIYIRNVKNIIVCDTKSSYNFGFFTNDDKDGWGVEYDEDHNVYVTLFTNDMSKMYDKIIYGEVTFFNSDLVNEILYNNFFINDLSMKFLKLPRYKSKEFSRNNLFVYMNTDFKKLLKDNDTFKNTLNELFKVLNIQHNMDITEVRIEEKIKFKKWNNIGLPVKGYEVEIFFTTNKINDVFGFFKMLHNFIIDFGTTDIFVNFLINYQNKTYSFEEYLN